MANMTSGRETHRVARRRAPQWKARALVVAGALAGVAAAPGAARADSASLDINRFRPAPGTEKIITTDLAAVGPDWQLSPQIFMHYADKPLVLTIGDSYQSDVVRHRITGEMSLALSLRERVQIGLSFPVTLFQDGDPVDLDPIEHDGMPVNPPANVAGAGPEDLRLMVKGVLWQDEHFGLGASGNLSVPTGDSNSYMSSSQPTFDARLLGHYRNGRLAAGVNLGWLFASEQQVLLTRTGMGLTFGAGLQYEVYRTGDTAVAVAGEVFGLVHSMKSSREAPVELLLAAKSEYQAWTFFLGGGPGLTSGYGEPNVRVVAGASFHWKPSPRPPRPVVVAPDEPVTPDPQTTDEPEDEGVSDRWVDSTMTLPSDVLFDYDRCAINPESYEELRKVAVALQAHPEWGKIRIEGHASNEGNERDDYNLALSRCRASRIVRFLVYYGVEEERLSYLGFGYRCPRAANDSEENRTRNRRVEFVRNPESNPPRCEVPPQLNPLPKHATEPEPYRTGGLGTRAPGKSAPAPGGGSTPAPGGSAPAPGGSAPAPQGGAARPGAGAPPPRPGGSGASDAAKPN